MPTTYIQRVENAIVSLLQDATTGLAAIAAELAAAAGVELPTLNLADGEGQLFRSWVDPNSYFATDEALTPAVFVYPGTTSDNRWIKGQDFSGAAPYMIRILLTSEDPAIPQTLQQHANIYADAMYTVFGLVNSNKLEADGVISNGGLKVARSTPVKGGSNWYQVLDILIPLGISS